MDKRIWLITLVWVLAVFVVVCQVASIVDLLVPYSSTGATVASDGKTIANVSKGSAADIAGLRAGDVLQATPADAAFASASALGTTRGRRIDVTYVRGSASRSATIVAACCSTQAARAPGRVAPAAVGVVVVILAILIAAGLASVRPGIMTLALFLATLNAGNSVNVFAAWPVLHTVLGFGSVVLTYNGFWPALLIFALRFPDDRVNGRRAAWQLAAFGLLVLSELAVVVSAIMNLLSGSVLHILFNPIANEVFNFSGSICLLLAGVILIARYVEADIRVRAQIRWALSGIVIGALFGSYQMVQVALGLASFNWASIPGELGFALLPACAAYALLRTRYIDPTFVLNRATVFAVTGALLAIGVAAIDWFTGHYISAGRLALAFEAGVTIALGFLLNALHRRVESNVERLLFRRRHEAAEYLRRLGATLSIATQERVVEEALALDAPRELGLASGAFFRRNPARNVYERAAATGWDEEHLAELTLDDPLIRFLRTERSPLHVGDVRWHPKGAPGGIAAPDLAIPVLLRGEVAAVVLYGAHRDHSEIDSSEEQELVALVERSSAALDHVEALALRDALAKFEDRYSALLATVNATA